MPSSDNRIGEAARSRSLLQFVLSELAPKGRVLTPFNVITGIIMAATAVILVARFAFGLGAVTNLTQEQPWGIWIGFDVITGVAFAGGAYVVTFMVYVLRLEKYHPIVRATVLNGMLAYMFYAGALLLDLGRPWNVVNPIIGNGFGVTSVLFLVAWHFLLYVITEFVEFSPAVAEWLGLERLKKVLKGLTLGAVVFGITLSTLHQSGLGALYLMAKSKVHPLWYSEFMPLLFFVSSIFAGLSMVILEGSITHRVFAHRVGADLHRRHRRILFGLGRICVGTMVVYLFLQLLTFVHGQRWQHFEGGWGAWYALEMVGFVALPMMVFAWGLSKRHVRAVQVAAVLALVGIILNRLNVSVIAYQWQEAVRYVPTWMEILVTAGVISAELWAFRWIVLRMPVLAGAGERRTLAKVEKVPARAA